MKKLIRNVASGLSMVAVLSMISCGSPNGEETNMTETDSAKTEILVLEEMVIIEYDIIMVHEDGFYHQHAEERNEAKNHEGHDHGDGGHAEPTKVKLSGNETSVKTEDITSYMESRSFETLEVDDTEELMLPVDVNQTLIAFDKKANFEGQVRVVSSSDTGEITHIVFTGKHHMDEYNISAGLTGHEARKLRRELKHMTKNGRIYLYEEGSNIVYIMDSKILATGEEFTQEDVDNMVIESVIWQDSNKEAN